MLTLDPCVLAPINPQERHARPVETTKTSRYGRRMPNQPEPEIVEAALDIGVDPQDLRDLLDSADLTPPTAEQTDDLPKLQARMAQP